MPPVANTRMPARWAAIIVADTVVPAHPPRAMAMASVEREAFCGSCARATCSSSCSSSPTTRLPWRTAIVAVPVPEEAALPREEADAAIAQAIADAESAKIHGPASTPWVLARVAELTGGRSVVANLALIESNARVAGLVAAELVGF